MNDIMCIVDKPIAYSEKSYYLNNRAPLKSLPFMKLPIGHIKPRGWLGKQLDFMLDGVTGRLPEFGKFFEYRNNGWLHPEVDSGWEEVPYWFRGFYSLAAITEDARCLDICRQYIDAMISGQDEDGYFGPKYLKSAKGKNGQVVCDLFPHMVILSAFIEHFEYTGDPRILPFLNRFFRFCSGIPDEMFIPLSTEGNLGWGGKAFGSMRPFVQSVRAGEMLPHLFWYYNQTGDSKALDLARRFFKHIRPPWDEWLDHHAVNFAQRYAYSGIYSQLSQLNYHMDQTEYWYNQHMSTWGQMPRGIFGADERIRPGCVDPRQAFETCGMVEFARNFYMLGRINGNAKYADQCEDIMLNHFPAAYTPDQKALHYLTAANMPQLDVSFHHHFRNGDERSNKSCLAYTPFNRCCGHNAGMGWPWYAQNLWQATSDKGLASWLYAECEVSAKVGYDDADVKLYVDTHYPFKGNVNITLEMDKDTQFPLYLRIPGWCTSFTVYLNGNEVCKQTEKSKFLLMNRLWRHGDQIQIKMEMKTSVTQWPRNGSITVDRGPLSYSIKIEEEWRKHLDIGHDPYRGTAEWPNWEVLPKTPWNYGLVLDRNNIEESVTVNEKERMEEQPWTVEGAPVEIKVKAKRIPNWTLQDETVDELQNSPIRSEEPEEEISMIPLGCARLRMSCLPMIDDSEEANEWQKAAPHIEFAKRSKNRFDIIEPVVNDKKQEDV
ncbi:beta-L-arabinofuranosidase domain-containing protein [Paenibacillus allorhizosphaerae]|uniref:Transcriptional initiation protein Tat n=1 Tax=Paenibacillus allorhizosphaerae TaxID=2849866 RepID=A0ABN7TFI1_9BACL|nr:beta-L-arabinofuranosidase domain-containing protein [Paenibacillus allorhizosphaerae]CAG7613728.1 hypothetical protein PAECIP111802_00007 [Paenibacillus allorhizosphaerae]